jgi:hypothetical protein
MDFRNAILFLGRCHFGTCATEMYSLINSFAAVNIGNGIKPELCVSIDRYPSVVCSSQLPDYVTLTASTMKGAPISWSVVPANIPFAVSPDTRSIDLLLTAPGNVFVTATVNVFGQIVSDTKTIIVKDCETNCVRCGTLERQQATNDDIEIKLSPNPAQEFVLVNFNHPPAEGTKLSLTDIGGKIIGQLQAKDFSNQFQLNGISSGTYCIVVETSNDRKTYRFEIVK